MPNQDKLTPQEYLEKREKADRFSELVEEKRPDDEYMIVYRHKGVLGRDWQMETYLTLEIAEAEVAKITDDGRLDNSMEVVIAKIIKK